MAPTTSKIWSRIGSKQTGLQQMEVRLTFKSFWMEGQIWNNSKYTMIHKSFWTKHHMKNMDTMI